MIFYKQKRIIRDFTLAAFELYCSCFIGRIALSSTAQGLSFFIDICAVF